MVRACFSRIYFVGLGVANDPADYICSLYVFIQPFQMNAWKDYQSKNKARFLNELLDLLRIPSVSADSKYKADVARCAEAVKESLLKAGADKAEVIPTAGHPIVYGEKIADPAKPTVLVY